MDINGLPNPGSGALAASAPADHPTGLENREHASIRVWPSVAGVYYGGSNFCRSAEGQCIVFQVRCLG